MRTYKIQIFAIVQTSSKVIDGSTVIVWNQGSTNVTINGSLTLTPGQSFTIDGYPGEQCNQAFDIVFPSVANGNLVNLIIKTYDNVGGKQ